MGEPAHAEAEPPPAASLATITIGGSRRTPAPASGKVAFAPGTKPARAAAPSAEQAESIEGVIAWWRRQRTAERLPSPGTLKLPAWPNTALFSFEDVDAAPQAIRLGGAMPTPSSITLTPALAIWLVDAARLALRSADICRESAWFGDTGAIEAILLPLSLHGKPDHVLYHLRRLT
jgi:hypothetical protein